MSDKQNIYNERYGVTISESGEVYIYDLETKKPKELVAEVFGQGEEAVVLANLMAAAPDLLEAAEEAFEFLSCILHKDEDKEQIKNILKATIKKARGENDE